ncbi:MAG: hypothetical protein GY786_07250, partial [Proteobacteria bacterium]|nr:hypothetical protein [Pseudomonadota bacterium]
MNNRIKIILTLTLAIFLFPSPGFSSGKIGDKNKKPVSVRPVDPAKANLWKNKVAPTIP